MPVATHLNYMAPSILLFVWIVVFLLVGISFRTKLRPLIQRLVFNYQFFSLTKNSYLRHLISAVSDLGFSKRPCFIGSIDMAVWMEKIFKYAESRYTGEQKG